MGIWISLMVVGLLCGLMMVVGWIDDKGWLLDDGGWVG